MTNATVQQILSLKQYKTPLVKPGALITIRRIGQGEGYR